SQVAAIGVDEGEGRDRAAEKLFRAGIADHYVASRCVGDDDTDGCRLEDSLQACFAAAEGFLRFFVVVNIFEGAIPAHDFAVFVATRGSAGPHPAPLAIAAADSVLDVQEFAGAKGFLPCS